MHITEDQMSFLFTLMTVFQGLVSIVAVPSLRSSFSSGVQNGGLMVSLLFFTAFTLYALSGLEFAMNNVSQTAVNGA